MLKLFQIKECSLEIELVIKNISDALSTYTWLQKMDNLKRKKGTNNY